VGTGFAAPPAAAIYRLVDARAPLCLVDCGGLAGDADGLTRLDLVIANGTIASILPHGTPTPDADLPVAHLDGGLILPRLVDVHTHLDKGHIWPRKPNPDGTFRGALDAVRADREANWTQNDLRTRMDFSLRAAFAHGTAAIRTHLDCRGSLTETNWAVFAEMRAAWKGRIALQASSLFPIDDAVVDEAEFRATVEATARYGGALGGVTFLGYPPGERLTMALDRLFQAATANGLDLDLHVDESDSVDARTLEAIADAALRHRFSGKILAGHCCSLALMPDADAARVIAKVAEAGIAIVSLPLCNMYLQDRRSGRTPRWRGVAPVHELKAAGVTVTVASDNTRDPFYAYGDLDMIEVFRAATRILQLDHSGSDWATIVASTPASIMGLPTHGRIAQDGPAGLVLTPARSWTEFFARPQADRTVLIAGQAIDTTLPDYRELDADMKQGSSPARDAAFG